jgi:CheY-like chemotaxis protein
LIGRLRARPAGANIPILAVSGLEPDASIPADRCFGFTQVLVKPVAPSHLVRTVVGYLCGNASEVPERVLSAIA